MAKFDMREQKVTYQYNADTINFGNVSNRTEFARQIDNMRAEISHASDAEALDHTQAENVQNVLQEVSVEVQKPNPDKSKVTTMLETAGNIVKGVTALGGLYLAITKAVEVAHHLF
jgi:flagellar biosynthesis chaperone FliJ